MPDIFCYNHIEEQSDGLARLARLVSGSYIHENKIFFGQVLSVRFIVVTQFGSNSNPISVIFIRSCETASVTET